MNVVASALENEFVDVPGWTWHYALLGLVLVAGLGAVGSAIRTEAGRLPRPRASWPWLLLLVMWTGDAVLGERRPPFERMEKGVFAALLWLSFAVVVWRRRHHRVRAVLPPSAADPDRATG